MAEELEYDLCPETGIGCLMAKSDSGLLKIDLMPDKAARLKELMFAGDLDAARALLVGIDGNAESAIDYSALQALFRKAG